MAQKLTAKNLRSLGEAHRHESFEAPGFNPLSYPFVANVVFVPAEVPHQHDLREFYDDRAMEKAAAHGWWDVTIWDVDNAHMPVAMAAFSMFEGKVYAARLSVEREYRGLGLGYRLIDFGQRLWGAGLENADQFTNDHEDFWTSLVGEFESGC